MSQFLESSLSWIAWIIIAFLFIVLIATAVAGVVMDLAASDHQKEEKGSMDKG